MAARAAVGTRTMRDAETRRRIDRRGNQRVHGPLIAGDVLAAAVERDEPVQSRSSTGGLRRPRRAGDDPCAGEATSGPGNPGEGFGVTSMTTRGASRRAPRSLPSAARRRGPRRRGATNAIAITGSRNRARPGNRIPANRPTAYRNHAVNSEFRRPAGLVEAPHGDHRHQGGQQQEQEQLGGHRPRS